MIYPDIAQCSHRGGHASIWPKLVILNIFWTKWDGLDINRGARRASYWGSWGASFLKICILGIFGDISSKLS